jgi:hypothetical protein
VNQIPIRSIATSCCFSFIFGPSQFLCAGNKIKIRKKRFSAPNPGQDEGGGREEEKKGKEEEEKEGPA